MLGDAKSSENLFSVRQFFNFSQFGRWVTLLETAQNVEIT